MKGLLTDIDYRIVINTDDKCILILSGKDIPLFCERLVQKGYSESVHRFSSRKGFGFLYGMSEPLLYEKQGEKSIEIYMCLASCCLEAKRMLPFERSIQKKVWESKKENGGLFYISEELSLLYVLSECMFEKRRFDSKAVSLIESKKEIIKNEEFMEMCRKVFFGYTGILLKKIDEGSYESVFESYLKFADY